MTIQTDLQHSEIAFLLLLCRLLLWPNIFGGFTLIKCLCVCMLRVHCAPNYFKLDSIHIEMNGHNAQPREGGEREKWKSVVIQHFTHEIVTLFHQNEKKRATKFDSQWQWRLFFMASFVHLFHTVRIVLGPFYSIWFIHSIHGWLLLVFFSTLA